MRKNNRAGVEVHARINFCPECSRNPRVESPLPARFLSWEQRTFLCTICGNLMVSSALTISGRGSRLLLDELERQGCFLPTLSEVPACGPKTI
jgi:hypothetical protein